MRQITENDYSLNWILAITGASITGFFYLICCFCSIQKALKDRTGIIERNCTKRNLKYLHEMGLDAKKLHSLDNRTQFAISKTQTPSEPPKENHSTPQSINKEKQIVHPPTKAKKISPDEIDGILTETVSLNPSTNSSSTIKYQCNNSLTMDSQTSQQDSRTQMPIVTSLRKPVIVESIPRVYYLRAHNSSVNNKDLPTNWITERLNNASSYANAQRQLQYGSRKAPLAKQNSGFSSMDEDSSASCY